MATKVLNLTFPKKKIKEPLVYQIGHTFKVVTNIIKANVTSEYGWLLLEVEGDASEIEKASRYLAEKGIIVEDIEAEEN
ncbi:TPA: FeS-binding protein [Candidatus Woesearchaeota archaeon]|nr:FeS-binding protein [Candidatus Woesearchaeota archaeon]HII69349.1 FeS-binding protein [Candidatus Woesearchaeota archaeon]